MRSPLKVHKVHAAQSTQNGILLGQVTTYFFQLTYLKVFGNEEDNPFTDKILRCLNEVCLINLV